MLNLLMKIMMLHIPRIKWWIFRVALIICLWTAIVTEVLRPRGVSLTRKVFYEPKKEFYCIDGSGVFPFYFVNDDYCDCIDGSDEPGTAACSDAFFHCENTGYIPKDIPSSRVNDDICDCCDGSDEYNSRAECVNSCMELGNKAREEARKKEELFRRGYQLFEEYSIEGNKIKEKNKEKLQNLKEVEVDAEKWKVEKEAIKNDAESREKAALSKYEAEKEALKQEAEELEMLKHEKEEKERAHDAFKELDLNHDGILSVEEIQTFPKFDNNRDGIVSEEEGKFYLHMKESMELEEFVTTGWMIMKPIYMIDKIPPTTPVQIPATPAEVTPATPAEEIPATPAEEIPQTEYDESEQVPYEHEDEDFPEELIDEEEDEEGEESEQSEAEFSEKDSIDSESEKKTDDPVYDEETQKLVNDANAARKLFKEAVDKLEEIQNEIKQIQEDIEADFGSQEQFAVLKGQCFEYTDHEYTYKLCPFDKASQMPKSGGSEINLGKWGHWAGPEDNKYSKMKYENGQSCWNGPSRSVMVLLYCGVENGILSASEPNRCEYLFEYSTPALCVSDQVAPLVHEHTEL